MNHKRAFAAIMILALFLRVIFVLILPVFEKPDEKAHFEFIEFISANKKLPVQQTSNPTAEFFQPPLYHYSVSFILSFIKSFTKNIFHQVILLRLVSVIFSMLTLYLTYKIASLIFKNKSLNLSILAFAAFLPSHVNFNSSVTNANFADFLTTLIIYLLILMIMKEVSEKKIYFLGAISGISLLTRLSIIPAIMTIPFAFVVKYYPIKSRQDIRKIIKPLIIIGIIALTISGWLFIRNFKLYGDFLGINAMKRASPPDNITLNLVFVARLLGWTFVTFWAGFGRTNNVFIGNLTSQTGIMIFSLVYLSLFIISLISVYGLYVFFKKYRKNKNILNQESLQETFLVKDIRSHKKFPRETFVGENILSEGQKKAFLVIAFYLAVLGFSFVSFNLYDFQPQGRLFFPAISVISIIFTFGLFNLFFNLFSRANENYGNKFLLEFVISLILLNIASIISILNYY